DLLKLYVYGYLNEVRSSRKLERECALPPEPGDAEAPERRPNSPPARAISPRLARVLPFVLTVVSIRSVTLFVSTLGVRSYSDQRYSSMQMSTTRHSSNVSTGRAAACGSSSTGSGLNRDTSRTRLSGGGVGRESGKGASTTGASAAETPARPKAVSR